MALEANEYLLLRAVQAAIAAISAGAEYHYSVGATAVKLDPNGYVEDLIAPDGARPFVIVEVRPDRWTLPPAKQLELVVPITIHWISDSTPSVDESRLQVFYRGCADIETCLAKESSGIGVYGMVPPRITQRRMDLAVDGAQVWAMLDVDLKLHRDYGAPNVNV